VLLRVVELPHGWELRQGELHRPAALPTAAVGGVEGAVADEVALELCDSGEDVEGELVRR
jgi:hypothetical protein